MRLAAIRNSRSSVIAVSRWIMVGWMLFHATGCHALKQIPRLSQGPHHTTASYHDQYGLQIEYPDVQSCQCDPAALATSSSEPLTLEDPSTIPALEMTLEEAVRRAVELSPVLRNLGGTVVSAPGATQTVESPALVAASPLQGTEAALSAFDAQYTQQLFWNNIDQPTNFDPSTFGPGADGFAVLNPAVTVGTNATFLSELSKQTATGGRFALRHNVFYTRNNVGSRLFPSAFDGFIEAEWRQPLLQGAGTLYNRIAGPVPPGNAFRTPGQYNGVLIARINEDVALADFENGVIQLVADVEQAYWNLALAYRVLEANIKGRESAQRTFQFQEARLEAGTGRLDQEAQARSQFFQFQAQVESSLGGPNGLYAAEQALRYLVGLPAADGRLIRPTTDPSDVRVIYDWPSAVAQAIDRRVEIRRQRFNVKRRELELIAAKLNYRPRLDFLAQYRWRGFGDDLIGNDNNPTFDNFYGSITSGDFQEGQAGIELTFPVGLRLAGVALAEAKLNVKRERAILDETQLRISHDLSSAARQIALTYQLMETNFNRFQADLNQAEVLSQRYRDGSDNISFLLQAQQLVVTSETAFYQSLINYNLALRDFHQEKGSLLAYNQVQLAEGPWAPGAEADAYQVGRHLQPRLNPDRVRTPRPLTSGPFDPSQIQPRGGQLIGEDVGLADAPLMETSETSTDTLPAPQ